MSAREDLRRTEHSGLDWLLASRQPSVRYFALTELARRAEDDPDVRRARAAIPNGGWVRRLFRGQKPGGYWEAHEPKTVRQYVRFLRFPLYRSSLWRGMVLADLGLTREDRRIRRFADRVFQFLLPLSSPLNLYTEEVCAVGNTARMMRQFGYGDDRRVRKLYDWMVEDQRENGGGNCAPRAPGVLDGWEAMAAFAVVPRAERSAAVDRTVARGAEFYLERRLFREGSRYPPWFRFHYPTHYYYDVLVGLDVLTRLGYAGDRRLRPALELLAGKRRRDGRWLLERVHPDPPPPGRGHPPERPLSIERAGEPSEWVTLTALRVLQRVQLAG